MKTEKLLGAGATLLATASMFVSTAAFADEAAAEDEKSPLAMTAPKGALLVTGHLDLNLSKDTAFKPVSLAPDLWYGATPKLTVGLTHSGLASAGFWGGAGAGLCLTGEDNGCGNILSNTALQARYDMSDKVDGLALEGGFILRDFDPFVLTAKLGAVYAKDLGPVQLLVAPNFQLGLTEREALNKEVLNVPVSLLYPLSETIAVGGQTGVSLPLSNTGDTWRLPLSLVGHALLSKRYYIFGAFTLPALAGGDLLPTGADARVLTLGGGASL